jgi:hypothetical protein|tara:strand:- start:207 stop:533 length:327 start_codon:yes stop_codon:yes gene_type:complete
MANIYCTATHTGLGFITHQDRNDFFLSGHPGEVWIVGDNSKGTAWINRVNGTSKTQAEAQAIVDGKIEEEQTWWDAQPAETVLRIHGQRPTKYILTEFAETQQEIENS